MQLSNEDNLRLNILLAQDLKAIRIDESKMIVYALSSKGDAKIVLNPNCRDDSYLRMVKELLSNKVTGSPGGYPVYIKRWTRMGQDRQEESLAQLLLLGEPEAVVAVVHAPTITPEIARHAWWAYPSSENARRLLDKKEIAESDLARELAEFLLEFLPFEVEHKDMIDTVSLCLQPGLLNDSEVADLWKRAKRKQSLYVGFLHSLADDLPDSSETHSTYDDVQQKLSGLVSEENIYATQLLRYLSESGQVFLTTILRVFDKAASQDTIVSMFHALSRYNLSIPLATVKQRNLKDAEQLAQVWLTSPEDEHLQACLQHCPECREQLRAMLVLAQLGEVTLFPIFGVTDALGSVMRKKLKPLTDPLRDYIKLLAD